MAFARPSDYVVVVPHVGGSKARGIKLISQREPVAVKLGFCWFDLT
jgi:hypothetical protein